MSMPTPSGRLRASLPTLVILALASFAFANAAVYISYASNPFVVSDGWYFVDAFLQKYYNGGVTLTDLYMKRSADDHAQPIHKLLLIWNADTFSLDFVVESYIGLAIAALAWLLMLFVVRQDNRDHGNGAWWMLLPLVAAAASLVSLSGGMAFNWSLVTLSYLGPLSMILLAIAAWQAVERHRWLPILLIAPVVLFTMDGTALICAISATCALALREIKLRGESWRRTSAALVVIVVAAIGYRLASHYYLHTYIAARHGGPSALHALMGFGPGELLKMALSIAALSVSDRPLLQLVFPRKAELVHQLLGVAVVVAHGWFWWRALRDRWNQSQFLAVTLMLFCYGAVAGIVLTRVTEFGPAYASQQRYLLMYQLGTVALALMAAGSDWRKWQLPQRGIVSLVLAGVVLLQVPLTYATWREAPYVQAWGNTVGRQMILLGHDPAATLARCEPMLTVCKASRAERVRSIELLRTHRLNAFSNRVLNRHSMQALKADPGPPELVPAP
ncbi:hypothetical protein [Stenotrophomonas sp. PS02300]|uniref:hypothetical protein n=1 Tax=Stenotrophomonas sp. PS02300 TaxID=2991426 RepID=UPI00249BFBEC|nr:hypothetical protein [Stenotrophomonas sp. PS02300]